ncbi:hypothetical protein EJ02DRAFT_460915 [Clathrospora elynae]|uniref:Uncharacterized protein n=1 Tax=Clathrospora elynae TaxID=706981 RepID=A0A6A5S3S4_9PLEO|nr:hypothetical protein EJ02DRAFT_460915 [Clathrospora elynae]
MSADDTIPWTTSRCNRLLRPLSSKLAKLRKEVERPRTPGGESRNVSVAFATKCSPPKPTNFTRPANKPRGFDKVRDPDWRPGAKPGAGKKTTYRGRGRRGGRPAGLQRIRLNTINGSRPGEIAFTPLISRMGGQLHSSPQVQISPLKKYAKNRGPLLVTLDPLAKHMAGDLHKLIQGLSEAYANLLQATTTGDEKRWKGTRSLMGACLRKLPAYIELEDHFARLDRLEEDGEEERDIANDVYKHLEAQFEHKHGQGWRPFKHVVRAHATTLMCNAITDEVLGLDNALILVTHCLNASAWDEAERLLLAYAPLIGSLTIPINIQADLFDPQRSPYLSSVKSFVEQTGRHRFLYDLLEHMLALELLPLEWLATDSMRPIWDRLVRTISANDHRTLASASQFFETVTLASIGLPDERLLEDEVTDSIPRHFVPSSREELRNALSTTFSSLFTVLCSIALVNNSRYDTAGRDIARRITRILDGVVIAMSSREDIQEELELLDADAEDAQVMAQRALWVIFASFVVHLDSNDDPAVSSVDASTSINLINWTAAQYSSNNINFASIFASLPTLISSTARGTGRVWKDDGFDQLKRLVTALMKISGCRLPHKLWTLKRLALDSAMEFANGTGDAEHTAYARDIEKKMQTQGCLVIMQSPQKNDSPTSSGGFRWEEGIGEWVTCTPFSKQNIKRQPRKPVRVLELLPTPVHSEDDRTDASEVEHGLPEDVSVITPTWEVTAFDYDDDAVPQSSPIKKAPRTSTSSLGKRISAPSPRVVIPAKRMHMTPPDTPAVKYYPELPEDKQNGPRRLRRSRNNVNTLTSRLRTQRSRTSFESGLRDLKRPTYAEAEFGESDTQSSRPSQDDSDTSSMSAVSEYSKPFTTHSKPSLRMRSRRSHIVPDSDADEASEHDELSKTPARPRPQLRRRISGRQAVHTRKEWWKAGGGVVGDSEDSEDELSFY